ncbi:MAG TPA: type II toxin-antitoxin system ParD family antitoxin [Dongiaceae bacterium]|nr:type II toxin-antitoxin system ParD family antitoxin [Dongiaceae bacterium]
MNIALTRHFEGLIARLVSSGRYNNASEVVRAGLRNLEAEERDWAANSFPPGSLKHLYTSVDNRAERRTARASTLRVETERNNGTSGPATSRRRGRTRRSSSATRIASRGPRW